MKTCGYYNLKKGCKYSLPPEDCTNERYKECYHIEPTACWDYKKLEGEVFDSDD